MLTSDALAPVVGAAFARVLRHVVRDGADVPTDLPAEAKVYARTKGERGRAAVAEALGLQEAELAAFDAVVRDVERTLEHQGDGPQGERNAVIAQVRLLSWLETIGQRVPALAPQEGIEALVSEDLGRKQVRALELIVRSLITESYADQEALVARLRAALNEKVVARWQAVADPGDILSGLTFSELASLFVDKEEFQRYEGLYEDTPFLTLLKQHRRTVQAFLDDVRRVRNVLAHNKRVTPTQLTLLDLYYEEIVGPVQTAHDEGETKVDPAAHLEVTKEDLDGYVHGLREDVLGVKDDLQDLRATLLASLGDIQDDTKAIRETTTGINRKVIAMGVGIVALLVLGFFLARQGGDTQQEVAKTRETTEAAERAARRAAKGMDEVREATGEVAKRVEASTEATQEVGKRVAAAAEDTARAARAAAAAAAASRAATDQMSGTTEVVVQTLEELRDGFAALTKQGGIIADPKRPQEYYHNARLYEQRGDVAQAMLSYRGYLAFEDLDFVDPHMRFQAYLKLHNGMAGAREAYYDLQRVGTSPVWDFAWNLLLDDEARIAGLETFVDENPEFAPAWYALSREYSVARLGSQTLADKRSEKEALERFFELKEQGAFLRFYLDQDMAVQQLEDAKERYAALSQVPEALLENPVQMTAMRSGAGWTVSFSIAEPAKEIFTRVGGAGEFRSTGHFPGMFNQAGLPMPKPNIELPGTQTTTTIEVKYADARGRERGPYTLAFDPQALLMQSGKDILQSLRHTWVSFATFGDDGLLLHFTALVSYRYALKEIRYGLDKDTPNETFPLGPYDPKLPWAIGEGVQTYVQVPGTTKYVVIQVVYADGTESEVQRIDR